MLSPATIATHLLLCQLLVQSPTSASESWLTSTWVQANQVQQFKETMAHGLIVVTCPTGGTEEQSDGK